MSAPNWVSAPNESSAVLASEAAVEVSVIICVRNGASTIRRQLDALDRQVRHPSFEVIVVDNGSSDETRRVVGSWMAASAHAGRPVRLVDGPRRAGIPRTRNAGALAAVGRVLAFCDADDEVEPGWVGSLARAVNEDQLVGGRILACSVGGRLLPGMFGDGLIATRYLPHVGGCNFALSRKTYLAVGGFDESLPAYGFEDVDFSWRVQRAGFSIGYEGAAVVHFTVSDNRASVKKKFALGRGRVLMAARYPQYDPTRYTVRTTLRDLRRELATTLGIALRERRADRRRLGQVVALLGRVVGSVQYRGGRRLPARKLLPLSSMRGAVEE